MTRPPLPAQGRQPADSGLVPVGRDDELDRIEAFLAALPAAARSLVIEGEAGIGKSTLWWYAIERCRRAGFHVVMSRPAQEEMQFALVGVADLFETAEIDGVAFDADASPLTRGRAVLDALRLLTDESPTVVAIDDLQWLDPVSAATLSYVMRRLDTEPVGMLGTRRSDAERAGQLGADSGLPPGRSEVLGLGPLSLGALRHLLSPMFVSISGPALRRIHEVSGGNPLYALELARALATEDRALRPMGQMVASSSLQSAVADRLDRMPPELAPLLEAVSALGRASVDGLQEVLGGRDVDALLQIAQRNHLLMVDEALDVRFSHPLLGSVVYDRLGPLARRSVHANLARHATDPAMRAHHVAMSSDQPDADVAQTLENASIREGRRGALDLAVELATHSLRLTPPGDEAERLRRALLQIEKLAAAGEVDGALRRADELVSQLPPGPGRAEALIRRAELEDDDIETGEMLLTRALEDAGDDAHLRGRVLDMLGWLRGVFRGDLAAGIRCADEALSLAGRVADPEFEMSVAAGLSNMSALAGKPRLDLMDRAVALEDRMGRPPLWAGPKVLLAEQLIWAGDLAGARTLLEAAHAEAVRSGNGRWLSYGLYDLASLECAAGNFATAYQAVQRARQAALDSGDVHVEVWIMLRFALVSTWLGRSDEARAAAKQRIETAVSRDDRLGIARARWVRGLLALSEGDYVSGADDLGQAARVLEEMGFANPGAIPAVPDAIEAFAASGDTATATALLNRLEREAKSVTNEWVQAAVLKSRGIVLLAEGTAGPASDLLVEAASVFDRLGHRPDGTRSLLACGRAMFRNRHRTRAAETLAEAHARFKEMGALLWEARAAEELERASPGRGAGQLTATERRIAACVAEGMRNQEIAQTLFMGVATVEGHLTRIYRKLGIRSRSELARGVADGSVQVSDA